MAIVTRVRALFETPLTSTDYSRDQPARAALDKTTLTRLEGQLAETIYSLPAGVQRAIVRLVGSHLQAGPKSDKALLFRFVQSANEKSRTRAGREQGKFPPARYENGKAFAF